MFVCVHTALTGDAFIFSNASFFPHSTLSRLPMRPVLLLVEKRLPVLRTSKLDRSSAFAQVHQNVDEVSIFHRRFAKPCRATLEFASGHHCSCNKTRLLARAAPDHLD